MKYNIIAITSVIFYKLFLILEQLMRISLGILLPKMDDVNINYTNDDNNKKINTYIFRPYQIVKLCYETKNRVFIDCPKARSGHRIVCTDSNLYCFGGFNPELTTTRYRRRRAVHLFQELWRFNFVTKRWKLCFSPCTVGMPEELASNALAVKGDMLILFGGTGFPFGEACSNKCHILCPDPRRPSITQLDVDGDLPAPLYGPAIVIHENYLYTIGGTTGFDYSCDIYRLDLINKLWECVYICKPDIQDDPNGRYRHEIVYDGKLIYILGGGTSQTVFDLETVPAFDLEKLKWKYIKTKRDTNKNTLNSGYPEARRCHSCIQYKTENDIEAVIAGGCSDTKYFSDIWKLNLNTMQWKLFTTGTLPNSIYFHDAATPGNGCMYLFGGIEMRGQLIRTNDLYKMWVTIPKLSEICWDAINHYNPNFHKYSKTHLLRLGIPTKFVNRVPDN